MGAEFDECFTSRRGGASFLFLCVCLCVCQRLAIVFPKICEFCFALFYISMKFVDRFMKLKGGLDIKIDTILANFGI